MEDHDKVLRVEDLRPGLGEPHPEMVKLLLQAIIAPGEHDAAMRELSFMLLQRVDNGQNLANRQYNRGGLSSLNHKRVREYVESELHRDLKIGELAAQTRLSTYHFMRAFKQDVGVSPHQYVIMRRIARSVQDLTNTKVDVEVIALKNGFSHASHLNHHLNNRFGWSARDLRRMLYS